MLWVAATLRSKLQAGGQSLRPPALLTIVSGGEVGAGRTPAAVLRGHPHAPEQEPSLYGPDQDRVRVRQRTRSGTQARQHGLTVNTDGSVDVPMSLCPISERQPPDPLSNHSLDQSFKHILQLM